MQNDLYYVRPEDINNTSLILQKSEVHHLVKVLRKGKNDRFSAVDGKGTAYDCQIDSINKNIVTARILKKTRLLGEPIFQLTLAVAIPKKDKFEWILEKGTEIGVVKFLPLLTERTIVSENSIKPQRCHRIVLAAMKQCHRSVMPAIATPVKFEAACQSAAACDLRLLAHEKEFHKKLDDGIVSNKKNGILFIGPEGGFTDGEIAEAREAGITIFGLGERRLRTETAALTAAALILDRMGELN